MKNKIVLFLILAIALYLRIIYVDSNPPSLNWDEASIGYNAYSILKTGRDEWNRLFPSIFRAFGDYKLPVYIYTTVVSIAIFGLNTFSVRLPSVLAGVGSVYFTYLLVLELFPSSKNKPIITDPKLLATMAALLVAVEPWSLFLSRAAFEANLAVLFIISGIYFFLKVVNQSINFPNHLQPKVAGYLLLPTILLGLSVWTYNSARIFIPLFMVVLIILYRKEILVIYRSQKHILYYSLFVILLFFIPMFYQLIKPIGQARYSKIALIDSGAVGQIIESRQNSQLPNIITRLVYNRPTYFIRHLGSNWLDHYNFKFLFFEGGSNYQFSVPGAGVLYTINATFLVLGFITLLKRRDRLTVFILSWFFLSTIPSSLTREAPHVLRASIILPMPMVISAMGLSRVLQLGRRKFMILALLLIYVTVLTFSLVNYWKKYFNSYRKNYSWSWQYGYKQAVDYAKLHYEDYDRIIFTKKYGEPHIFVLVNYPWNPSRYQKDASLIRFDQSNWYWVDRFDKFYFINDWNIPEEEWQDFVLENGSRFKCLAGENRCLLITSPGNMPNGWSKLEDVEFLDGKPAFEIYEKR